MSDRNERAAETDLGHPDLDAEHRGQLELMNRLDAGLAAGRTLEELVGDFDRLVAYLDAHFVSEQIVMREQSYEGYADHLREHEQAISLLRDMQARYDVGDARMTAEILAALRGWLLAHVQTTDRKLAEFMLSRGISLYPARGPGARIT